MSRQDWIRIITLAAAALVTGHAQAAQLAAPAPNAASAVTAVLPPLVFREAWRQPTHSGELTDENRRITPEAVGNANLKLNLYGADARLVGVYSHEGRLDLWTGMTTSPVAVTLSDKSNYLDLSVPLARVRWTTRTQSLHVIHAVVKLADGTLLAGSRGVSTEGEFLLNEVTFANQRWFKLDPVRVVTTVLVDKPDLSRVDEIGFVDLMPGGGHGNAGWVNVSALEVYAGTRPRQ
jgi:hypothetical protein